MSKARARFLIGLLTGCMIIAGLYPAWELSQLIIGYGWFYFPELVGWGNKGFYAELFAIWLGLAAQGFLAWYVSRQFIRQYVKVK